MKRLSSNSDSFEAKRRKVSLSTYNKWRTEMDKDCNTLSWLECETSGTAGKKTVEKLMCEVCIQFQSKIAGRSYSDKWISGASSVGTSNIRDHSKSDQHAHAVLLLRVRLGLKALVPALTLQ